ncbi:MAG TPA: T9SS type A sorting domain-containing protein, partial [Flavobacterium sp.]|nr:T9SS type A sorting domain-containing protein [Flavobacterium sp.]
AGNYTIAIDELDGIFSGNQNVYLRDNFLGIEHDIKSSAYNFITNVGTFDNRFEIVYRITTLGFSEVKDNTTFGMINDQLLTINSSEIIKSITVFDIAGKMILNSDTVSAKQFTQSFNHPNGVYIAKVKLNNGFVANVKLIK